MKTKIDRTIIRETTYIAISVLILSVIMELVFILIKRWDYTVILGNLLGAAEAVLNFFLMGMMVQEALGKDEKAAQNTVRLSQLLRMMMLFVTTAIGAIAPCFNIIAALLPLLFPRLAIIFRPLFGGMDNGDQ